MKATAAHANGNGSPPPARLPLAPTLSLLAITQCGGHPARENTGMGMHAARVHPGVQRPGSELISPGRATATVAGRLGVNEQIHWAAG